MTEPFPNPRAYSGGVDLRSSRTEAEGTPDPLAELARLVGREDPFKDLLSGKPGAVKSAAQQPVRLERGTRFPVPEDFPDYGPDLLDGAHETPARYLSETEARSETDFHVDPARGTERTRVETVHRDDLRFPALTSEAHGFEAVEDDRYGAAPQGEAPPLNADLWAQGMPEHPAAAPVGIDPEYSHDTKHGGSQRRTLVVLAAVVALTAGGLGTTFLLRGGHSNAAASGGVPTIMADASPTKVQPPEIANAGTGGDGTTALLEKSASDNVANAKVVDTQERPIDLAQLPKTPPADDGRAGPPVNGSPFPEPRKVKTVLIRPDGSVVGQDAPASAPRAPAAATATAIPASVAPDAAASAGVPPPVEPAARAATPKSTARVSTTPKSTSDGVAPVKPKPGKPKVVETADAVATPADATATASSGGFAVQLAAPASEQEAKDAAARLQKKFGDALGSHKPGVKKADKGTASVYRVRVGNLTQDDATSMCSKIKSSGGTCFVVRN